MSTTATRDGEDYILNGQKTWISLCDIADYFIVFAYTDKSRNIMAFLRLSLNGRWEGFHSKAIKGKYGIRAGNTGEFFSKI